MKMGLWITLAIFFITYPPELDKKITIISLWASVLPGVSHKTRNSKTSVRKQQQLKSPYSSK
jgi:hypothetical protein